MKKLLAVSLSAFVVAFLAVAIIGPHLFVEAGPPPRRETRTSGDTNCDQKLDMSDAIFTLNYLFQGTAFPPCPIADPPELVARIAVLEAELAQRTADLEASAAQVAEKDALLGTCQADLAKKAADLEDASDQVLSLQSDLAAKNAALTACQTGLTDCTASLSDCRHRGLPATGQTKCYNVAGVETPCDSATCPGQDGFYATGCSIESRFVDNGDGTVRDNCTELMWRKDTADVSGDGSIGTEDILNWQSALKYCENLSFAGHDDWRLPSARELQSIVSYGRTNPALDPVFGALSLVCWSSTSIVRSPGEAWYVYFNDGNAYSESKGNGNYVRAVRNAP